MNHLIRSLSPHILEAAKQHPLLTLTGPQGSGKTTLIKHLFPEKPYVSLENDELQKEIETSPETFLKRYPEGAILDEVESIPGFWADIHRLTEQGIVTGHFVLIGSHELGFNSKVHLPTNLIPRPILTLLPPSLDELTINHIQYPLLPQMLKGFYPEIYTNPMLPSAQHFYRQYLQAYIEKHAKRLTRIPDIFVFQHFLKLCAIHSGQLTNFHQMATELKVSNETIKRWLQTLEASGIIFRLEPYAADIGRRLIKSPKVYFHDVGLACYLLNIHTETDLQNDSLRGSLVENLVVSELMKYQYHRALEPHLYFYRDQQQHEVDVVYESPHGLVPMEIKSSHTFHPRFLYGVEKFSALFQGQTANRYIIYCGDAERRVHQTELLNYRHAIHALK
ncbi:MAG: ATP-binding protein [Gammaproteobacteria bacterium]|nr:ATP-binding protein [Gammaproteobacteria bacterium]